MGNQYCIIEYKGYHIEFDLYGNKEYTVQFCGDDIMFESDIEAMRFIDEIR